MDEKETYTVGEINWALRRKGLPKYLRMSIFEILKEEKEILLEKENKSKSKNVIGVE